MKFGFLGFAHGHAHGYAGCIDALPDSELIAIYDHDELRLAQAVAQYGGTPYLNHHDLLARADVDAVIVMAETAHHCEFVLAAAPAGKHILCEKPIATTHADALRMVEACRNHGVRMATAFPMRFSPPMVNLRRRLINGAIGTPRAVNATNPGRAPGGWFCDPTLAGGGAVMDHVVHVADLLRWIFQTEIVEVYAEIATRIYPGSPVEDIGLLLLRLENGMTASLDSSWSRPVAWPTWGGLTVDVIGDRGVVSSDAFSERLRLVVNQGPEHIYVPWGENADMGLLHGFIDAIECGEEVPVTGYDGLKALEVALCAYESARRGEPVACPAAIS